MIAFFQLRAVESVDPWEKIEIDPVTRALAEQAAAAAGLNLEEWLERAICRAGAELVRPLPAEPPSEPLPASPPSEPAPEIDAPPVSAPDRALEFAPISDADIAPQQPLMRRIPYHWALMAAGIVLAVAAGMVSAQYLIPERAHAVRVALDPTPSADSQAVMAPEAFAPAAPRPTELGPDATATEAITTAMEAAPAAPASTPPTTLPSTPGSTTTAASPPMTPSAPAAPEPVASTPAQTTPGPAPVKAAAQDAPRKVAVAKPPAAAPRNPPSAPSPDATAKADKSEAPSDPQLLAPWLEARAKTGDATSQYRLGVLYALGEGVAQDYQRAAALFKTAAEDGVAEAQYNIAVMYAEGLGIGRDPNQAVFWYRKAASQGSASAAFNLGVAYSNGVGVERSMEQAAQWFLRAAEAGVVNAQFNIGLLYERGEGVLVSQIEAFAWYSAAATHGDTGAAQRRDRLASILSPALLKDAQARTTQIEAMVQSNSSRGGAPVAATPITHKP